jgi:hypothetical protein
LEEGLFVELQLQYLGGSPRGNNTIARRNSNFLDAIIPWPRLISDTSVSEPGHEDMRREIVQMH